MAGADCSPGRLRRAAPKPVAPGAAGARRGGNRDIRHPSIGGFCLRAQAAVASTLDARPQAATPTTRR